MYLLFSAFMLSDFSNAMLFLENRFSIKKKSSKAYMLMTECRKRFCLNTHNKKRRHRMKSKKYLLINNSKYWRLINWLLLLNNFL